MTSPTIHRQLRTATDSLHQQVDAQAGEFDLATPGGQSAFLQMMVRGLSAVEPALDRGGVAEAFPSWPARRRLEVAREELGKGAKSSPERPLEYADEAEMWGALYVLEGSRLGSRLLAREAPGSRFLRLSAEDRTWPDFLKSLAEAHHRLDDSDAMIRGAEKTFAAFLR